MKLSHLKQIVEYLKQFKKIAAIHRVNDTIIKIAFDRDDEIYFNMTRSNSSIFKCKEYPRSKVYNAPFDVILAKRFNRSNILGVELLNDDKIIRFKTSIASAYKEELTYLQLEFTGKYTNIIVLDENNIVLEALRHIDLFSSFREVRVGQKLLDIPQAPFIAKEYPIEDVESFLYGVYDKEQEQKLASLKKQKISSLEKKLKKLEKLYKKLDSEELLQAQASEFEHLGNLVLANAQNIKPYVKKLELNDYDGSVKEVALEKQYPNAFLISESFFTKSKKAKQRARHLHIEEESLRSKIEHTKLFINTVSQAKDTAKIELLFPKQIQNKKIKKDESIETFWIEGYKVQLGKNEKGNIKLLESAKAKDIWLHLKDRPSTHVIITTDKQSLPERIIKSAARLCVDFSTASKDKFLVDYTPRREVNIQNGANVLYNKYKTVEIDTRE
ncbi:NFACT RNA binding domain-containing protein [Sulfurimonas microaerophilic]|uniref:NFACT RNA binding domain-containing protein n=1 Tax=Sulfurimonas microaerophilic TaxID=3058392 RepID=UPI0027152096|nr:NFACT RNA binding domain-containing protein [Sulfurimonas sp. hsl 1-7]